MSLAISDSHPALSLTARFKEYCDHFLKKHHLNYFQMIRVYRDGSTLLLTNRAEFTRFAIQHALSKNVPLIYSAVKKEAINASSYYFLWEPNLPVAPVAIARNEFNVTNGLTFVERYLTHYDMVAFAAPTENLGVLDFYLNNIDTLTNFIQGFKYGQKTLLKTLESQPIILPPPLMDENLTCMLLKNRQNLIKRIPITVKNCKSYLTEKEYACIKQLPMGLTAKQIGKNLNISYRTVETYFERVKNRTGCSSKQELIELLLQ